MTIMNSVSLPTACRPGLGVLVLTMTLTLQACAVAERSWETTKSVSQKAWTATKQVGSNARELVGSATGDDDSIGFEYQWQLMTGQARQIAAEDLSSGKAKITLIGLGGRPACAVVDARSEKVDIIDSVGSSGSSAMVKASGFDIQQVGSIATNRQCSPSPTTSPAEIQIMTDQSLVIGPPMGGKAQVRVGDRIFDSTGLYFRFWLESIDVKSGQVAGRFEFMGADQANPNSRETLFIANGRFSIGL